MSSRNGVDNSAFSIEETHNGTYKTTHEPQQNIQNISPKYGSKEPRRMTINVVVLGAGFMLLFTAYNGMANLMSSFYPGGLGTYTNALVYCFFVLSALFLPSMAIKLFTVKWCIVIPMIGYLSYMAAQYHPRTYTLLPAAALVGLCAAPLWTSQAFYLNHIGGQYATLSSKNREISVSRFFGIFFMLFQSGHVWGNLISSTVLSSGEILTPNETQREKCGIKFCPGDLSSGSFEVSAKNASSTALDQERTKIYIFSGVCITCAIAAIVLIGTFLDPLTRYGEKEREAELESKSGWSLVMATLSHMRNPYQLLIIPLTTFSGLEQGFLSTDFTQAFVTCSVGVHRVGFVLVSFGTADAILSIAFSAIIRRIGRIPVFTFGAVLSYIVVGIMLAWMPSPETDYMFYIIAAIWGVMDAVWHTQLVTFYGTIFQKNEEAAFSNYRVWEAFGFILAYVNGALFCVKTKLFFLIFILTVGMVGFYTIQFKENCRRKREGKVTNKD